MFTVRADEIDTRDFLYEATGKPVADTVDLTPWASRVEDQGHLGSCTGQAVVGAYELSLRKMTPAQPLELSSLFAYFNARVIEGYTDEDVGAYVRSAIDALAKWGVCLEALWPYRIEEFDVTPPVACYADARQRRIKNYRRLSTLPDIKDALTQGLPVVAGMQVYSQFTDLDTRRPVLQMPYSDEAPIGGHAVCIVGYNSDSFLVRNSFGADWANNGYFWMPFEYAERETMDLWVFDLALGEAQ